MIIVERGELNTNRKIQYLIYYISEVLSESKTWYFHIMKLTYALLITSCKLSHYFHAHQIEVSHLIDYGWNTKQQGGNWENYQMSHWVVNVRHCLQAKDSDQCSSFKRLHGQVDRDSDTS
jgi:hypothetical protein